MPVHTVRRTGRPRPKSNYELFNCNNLNIRYWSWNYRGCWPYVPEANPQLPSRGWKTRPATLRGLDDRGLLLEAVFVIDWD